MDNDILNELSKYSLTDTNISFILKNIHINKYNKLDNNVINKKIKKNKKHNKIKENKLFIPNKEDQLFWCWLIILNGYSKYYINENNKNNLYENTEKFKLIEQLNSYKNILKQHKFKLSKIENNLQSNKINVNTLIALSLIHKINIIIITDKLYYESIHFKDKKCHIIKQINNDNVISYGIYYDDDSNIDTYKQKLLIIDDIDKPLKNISKYKKSDLIVISNKLNTLGYKIDIHNKLKKCIYQEIHNIIGK